MVSGNATSSVRRTPYRSMPTPMNSCMVPNANAKAPANTPSAWADSPNSARNPVAMMAVMVRNAWLSAKPDTSASSMAQAARDERSGTGGDAGRAVGTGAGLQVRSQRLPARGHRPQGPARLPAPGDAGCRPGRAGRGWVGAQRGVEGFPRVCPSPALHTPPRWSGAGGFELLMPVIKCFLRYWVFWCDQFSPSPGPGRSS